MILTLMQLIPPGQGDNAYIWLSGVLASALVFVYLRSETHRNAQLKREQDRADKLVDAIPELVNMLREWKEAQKRSSGGE